jgi:hypothetical protein
MRAENYKITNIYVTYIIIVQSVKIVNLPYRPNGTKTVFYSETTDLNGKSHFQKSVVYSIG